MTTWLIGVFMALLEAGVQQGAAPQLRILEPTKDSYLIGPSVMRAAAEPASEAVQHMTFFADGRVVCRVEQPPFECPWNAGALRHHDIRVEALLASGRRISANITTKGSDADWVEHVDRVQVVVSVMDGGHFVRGLPHSAFHVFEDDRRQKTTFFPAQECALELAVGVDISESMTEAIEAVKQNVKRFLSALRPADSATVGVFNENYFVLAPPNVDRPTQLKRVDHLAPWGMTSFYEMVLRSFDQLSSRQGRRALVLFTDGEDTSSRVPKEAVEKRTEWNEAVLYIIGQGKVLQSAELKALCERLATKSGGRAFFPRDLAGLAAAFDAITEELANQYLLTYEPPSSVRDGRYHRIRVEVDGHKEVRATPGYTLK